MSALSRRFFLRGAATLPVIAATTSAAGAAVSPPEDPSVEAVGEQIEPLLRAYRAAKERHKAARAAAEGHCPQLPDELVLRSGERTKWAGWACTQREIDIDGQEVWPERRTAMPPREIFKADLIKHQIEDGMLVASRRTKVGKRIQRLIQLSEKYEAEREAAIEQSGLRARADELQWAQSDLDELAWRARELYPLTMSGVLIQARALAAFAECENKAPEAALILGGQLTANLLRVSGVSAVADQDTVRS